jgi:hypothetical protein
MVQVAQKNMSNMASPDYSTQNLTSGLTQGLSNLGQGLSQMGVYMQKAEEAKYQSDMIDGERRYKNNRNEAYQQIRTNANLSDKEVEKLIHVQPSDYTAEQWSHLTEKGLIDNSKARLEIANTHRIYNQSKAKLKLADHQDLSRVTTYSPNEFQEAIADGVNRYKVEESFNYRPREAIKVDERQFVTKMIDMHAKSSVANGTFNKENYAPFKEYVNDNYLQDLEKKQEKNRLDARIKVQKLAFDDPAQFALSKTGLKEIDAFNPDHIQMWSMIANQDYLPDHEKSILTNSQSAILARGINSITDPELRLGYMKTLEQKFNEKGDYWKYVKKDLLKQDHFNGANKDLLLFDPKTDASHIDLNMDMQGVDAKTFIDNVKARYGVKDLEIGNAVREELEPLFESDLSVVYNVNRQAQMQEIAIKYAYGFISKGHDVQKASRLAVEMFTNKYDFTNINGNKTRVPIDYEDYSGYLGKTLEDELDNLKVGDIGIPQNAGDLNVSGGSYHKYIKENGLFVLNDRDNSYYLDDGFGKGRYARDPEGNVIKFSIDDMMQKVYRKMLGQVDQDDDEMPKDYLTSEEKTVILSGGLL